MNYSGLFNKRLLFMAVNLVLTVIFVFQLMFTQPAQAGSLFDESTPTPDTLGEDLNWLSFPSNARALSADRSLVLLAGKLINQGLVDASACLDNGLMKNGAASPCGEIVARSAVIVWQNQFDVAILDVANQSGVPPFMLKNVLAQETQFWPSSNPTVYGYAEMGLGHITEMGADTLLRWNPTYQTSLCLRVFSPETCEKPFVFMPSNQQAAQRGMVMQDLNADCGECTGGINLPAARQSIGTIAAVLRANYTHAQWVSGNLSRNNRRGWASQSLLWRFALAGYNAGPGCLTTAMVRAYSVNRSANWKIVTQHFDPACQGAVEYVNRVTELHGADPLALQVAATDTNKATLLVNYYLQQAYPELFVTPETSTPQPSLPAQISPTPEIIPETVTPEATLTAAVTPGSETPQPSSTFPPTQATITPSATTSTFETPSPSVTLDIQLTSVGESATSSLTPDMSATLPVTTQPSPSVTPTKPLIETVAPTLEPTITPVVFNEIVVKFGGLVPEFLAEFTVGSAGGKIQAQVEALGLTIVSAPEDQIPQVLAYLQDSLLVDYAEPNYTVQAFYTPNDPGYINQTYLADMQIPAAWDVTKGEGVIVAVIDTGVDVLHPDLASNILINPGEDGLDANGNDRRSNYIDDDSDGYVDNWMGWNFVDNNNDARDGNGHGTHVAGIIAAQMDNAQGISGIAPRARIMPIKALDDTGFGSYSQVAQAILYAVDHGAKVINLGFGGTANSAALLAATNYAYDHKVVVVAAGGNTGSQTLLYPAANPNVIGVSALDENLNIAAFSSFSTAIQISAPGVGIYSTMPGGNYASMSGTSMSAAQVSGVAALLVSKTQFDTADKVQQALFKTASDLGNPGADIYYGYGLVQAFDALGYGTIIPTATTPAQLTPTSIPATPDPSGAGGVNAMAQEVFWAQAQNCTTLTNGANSLVTPYAFDAAVASCANTFSSGSGWVISDLWRPIGSTTTSYTSIYSASMEIRFSMSAVVDNTYEIQYSPNNGTNWYTLDVLNAASLPPAALTSRIYNVSSIVDTPAEVNNFQARIWLTIRNSGAGTMTINLDQVSLTAVQNTAPTVSIPTPGNGASFVQGRLVTFTGTSTDAEQGALTGLIVWKEGATTLGSGGSFNTTTLSLGSHTITASVTDNRGLTASASVTITINANTAPTVAITSPVNGSSFAKGASITFTGTATDAQDGNIASNLSWVSDIDGPLGTGASFSITRLTPGTHTITAQVTDLDGATGSASITLTVTHNQGPHGGFSSTTDLCALCHRAHTAQANGLLTYSSSAYDSNDFCLSCHSSGVSMVSTHSNKDVPGKKEAVFELLCIQCHDPHGSSNLFAVRRNVRMGVLPTNYKSMTVLPVPVVFTALKNADSFDEVDIPEDAANNADDICVTCHINPGNPGAPIASHAGGPNHLGNNNYVGQSCIYCHPHNADSNSSTKDGFMPVRGSCVGCHATVQGTRRAIVGASGDFVRASHHANASVTDADCQLCHDQSQHMAGKVRLLNVDTPSTVYALDGLNDPADYENFCLSCHDSNGAKGDTSPFSDNINMAGTRLQINITAWNSASHKTSTKNVSSCINCHDNGHGSNKSKLLAPWNYVSAGSPAADLMKQEEYFCYECHKSGGVAATDIMTNYTLPTRWVQLAAGGNTLTTLNDRHDVSTPDQTISGTKIECVSCHNPHTDNSSFKVITDPDPTDGRVPGTGYFTQGNTTDFSSDWCLDCHDGSYPSTIKPPTNALVNIYGFMNSDTHGAASGNVGTLEAGFGYTINTIVQCRKCHGIHVQAPTPVNAQSNFFSLLLRVRNFNNTADIPTDPTASNLFTYEVTNNSVSGLPSLNINGYNWCQTCHTASMGDVKTNCFSCHYHGSKW